MQGLAEKELNLDVILNRYMQSSTVGENVLAMRPYEELSYEVKKLVFKRLQELREDTPESELDVLLEVGIAYWDLANQRSINPQAVDEEFHIYNLANEYRSNGDQSLGRFALDFLDEGMKYAMKLTDLMQVVETEPQQRDRLLANFVSVSRLLRYHHCVGHVNMSNERNEDFLDSGVELGNTMYQFMKHMKPYFTAKHADAVTVEGALKQESRTGRLEMHEKDARIRAERTIQRIDDFFSELLGHYIRTDSINMRESNDIRFSYASRIKDIIHLYQDITGDLNKYQGLLEKAKLDMQKPKIIKLPVPSRIETAYASSN
jgi:hypothetical protein